MNTGSNYLTPLRKIIKGKTLIVGIGNSLKKDDGVGIYFINLLKKQKENSRFLLLDAGNIPENYLGKIKSYKADSIVFIDALDFSGKAGEVRIFSKDNLVNFNVSTHSASLGLAIEYLEKEDCLVNIAIIGFQPKKISFGEGLSKVVAQAAQNLAEQLLNLPNL